MGKAIEAIAGNSLAQVETENFWDDLGKTFEVIGIGAAFEVGLAQVETENFFDDVGDWFGGAAKTVASGVTGATIALGTEKFWNGLGNGALEATEGAVAAAAEAGI